MQAHDLARISIVGDEERGISLCYVECLTACHLISPRQTVCCSVLKRPICARRNAGLCKCGDLQNLGRYTANNHKPTCCHRTLLPHQFGVSAAIRCLTPVFLRDSQAARTNCAMLVSVAQVIHQRKVCRRRGASLNLS